MLQMNARLLSNAVALWHCESSRENIQVVKCFFFIFVEPCISPFTVVDVELHSVARGSKQKYLRSYFFAAPKLAPGIRQIRASAIVCQRKQHSCKFCKSCYLLSFVAPLWKPKSKPLISVAPHPVCLEQRPGNLVTKPKQSAQIA